MFKRTAVPPVGPSEHQARQPLNMALDLQSRYRQAGAIVDNWSKFMVLELVVV